MSPDDLPTIYLRLRVIRIKNWTDPGPDMFHAYWLKKLTSLHKRLAC